MKRRYGADETVDWHFADVVTFGDLRIGEWFTCPKWGGLFIKTTPLTSPRESLVNAVGVSSGRLAYKAAGDDWPMVRVGVEMVMEETPEVAQLRDLLGACRGVGV